MTARGFVPASEALWCPVPASEAQALADTRQATASHAATILGLLEPNTVAPPPDVSPVALAWAQTICDYRPDLADQLAGLVRDTAPYDPVELAEALMRQVDIPEDSPGGETLSFAFINYLGMAMACSSEEGRRWNAETAVSLAAEAVCVWAREPGHDLRHPSCVNNPATLLVGAGEYLANRKAETHA